MAKFIPRLFTVSEPAEATVDETDSAPPITAGVAVRSGRHAARANAVTATAEAVAEAEAESLATGGMDAIAAIEARLRASAPVVTGTTSVAAPDTDTDAASSAGSPAVAAQKTRRANAAPTSAQALVATPAQTIARADLPAHPSAPIPVLGDGVGASIRNTVGDSELEVFPVSLGTSVFGWTAESAASEAILNRYADFGGNFIDTADSYSGGRSEHIIGRWMSRRRNRDDMVVATKIGRHPDSPGLGPVNMVRAVEASLERLDTDHIDLLYFHDDDDSVRLEDALGTAQWLIETGKVRYLGVSNFTPERLIEARILAAAGYPRFEAVETHYSLLTRERYEGGLQLVAQGQGLGVMPYYALENGFLTGKYRSRADFADRLRSAKAAEHLGRRGLRVLKALDQIALEIGVSVTTIAIAWLQHRPGVAAPVVSASRPEQVDAIVQSAGVQLTRTQVLDLERASRI
jgi:aryl-alcohol dehydrogenase-like predicted oxidoreductase